MKKFSLLIAILFPFALLAQKSVDLDKYRFSVQYRSLPSVRIDSTYRTYNVETETTKLMQSFLQDLMPENSVILEGWKKLAQEGHITIKVIFGDLIPESFSIKERTETKKNKSGVITSTKTIYHQEVVYSFEATAIITDYKGIHIKDHSLFQRQYKQVYRSPEFPVRYLAEGYFLLNSMTITRDLYRINVNKAINALYEKANNDFGFKEVAANDIMWIIDSRKHPEYTAHRNAFQQMNEVLFNMNANTPITDAEEKLKPVIDYFQSIKKKYTSSNRHDRKIRYASFYNLAVLYYYLDDPQMMMKEANGLELNDFDGNDAKGFVRTATWLKNLFQQNNIYTRHFSINTDEFRGPYENKDDGLSKGGL